eukprot:Gb_03451 [translate_table: standard]
MYIVAYACVNICVNKSATKSCIRPMSHSVEPWYIQVPSINKGSGESMDISTVIGINFRGRSETRSHILMWSIAGCKKQGFYVLSQRLWATKLIVSRQEDYERVSGRMGIIFFPRC